MAWNHGFSSDETVMNETTQNGRLVMTLHCTAKDIGNGCGVNMRLKAQRRSEELAKTAACGPLRTELGRNSLGRLVTRYCGLA